MWLAYNAEFIIRAFWPDEVVVWKTLMLRIRKSDELDEVAGQ